MVKEPRPSFPLPGKSKLRIGWRRSISPRNPAPEESTLKNLLLAIPCLLAIAVPLYNSDSPRLFGFPFFYWAMFALVPISALFIYAVYRLDGGK